MVSEMVLNSGLVNCSLRCSTVKLNVTLTEDHSHCQQGYKYKQYD